MKADFQGDSVVVTMTQAEFFERFGETKQNICLRTDYFRPAEYISNKETDLTQQVTDALVRLGIPRHIKGFEYLRQAVILSVNDKTLIEHITKRLYPEVAAMFETTPSRVERAIRHAIEVGCSKDPDWMGLTFNRAMSVLSDKPVNSEFIATIADNIRLARQ